MKNFKRMTTKQERKQHKQDRKARQQRRNFEYL